MFSKHPSLHAALTGFIRLVRHSSTSSIGLVSFPLPFNHHVNCFSSLFEVFFSGWASFSINLCLYYLCDIFTALIIFLLCQQTWPVYAFLVTSYFVACPACLCLFMTSNNFLWSIWYHFLKYIQAMYSHFLPIQAIVRFLHHPKVMAWNALSALPCLSLLPRHLCTYKGSERQQHPITFLGYILLFPKT